MQFSIMIIIIMTALKLYGIVYPMKANRKTYNIKKAAIHVFLIFIFCSFVNIHFILTHSIVEIERDQLFDNETISTKNETTKLCFYIKWNDFYHFYWPYIDAIFYSFLPFILLTILNVMIIINIKKTKKRSFELRKQCIISVRYSKGPKKSYGSLVSSNLKNFEKTDVLNLENYRKRRLAIIEEVEKKLLAIKLAKKIEEKKAKRLTLLIVLIDISYLILTMPIVIFQILDQLEINEKLANYKNVENEETAKNIQKHDHILLKSIFTILQFLNHSLNFFFYCFSGQTFRNETKKFFSNIFNICFKRKKIEV